MKRVCLVSSGTGGHLLPALSLARALRGAGHQPMLVTEGRAVERELLARFDCDDATPLDVGRGPVRLAKAILRARRLLKEHGVDLVVGTGGRTSVPVALAAKSLGLPLALLEQNARPGRANRVLLPFARRIYCGLPPAHSMKRAVMTGTPLREELGRIDQAAARRELGVDCDQPVVFVTGGSQGAQVLNDVVPRALVARRQPLTVLHLSGVDNDDDVRRLYADGEDFGLRALVRPLVREMATYYAAADLVICRGGGGTVAELMAAGRAAILVPYPHHRDRQQWHNGQVLAHAGAGIVVEQSELDVQRLVDLVDDLLRPDRTAAVDPATGRQPLRATVLGTRAAQLGAECFHAKAPKSDACDRILADLRHWQAIDG